VHPRRVHLFFYLPKKREKPICMNISCTRKRMPQNRTTISDPRVGRNSIRPTNDPERDEYVQTRTTVSYTRARIRVKPHESRIHPKMDDANTRRSFSAENVCRAYAIRPYTGTKMVRAGLRRSFSTENVCRAYAIRPYTGTKMVRAGLRHSFSAENVCEAYSIRPYTGMKMVRAGWHIPDSFHYSTFAL